MAKLSLVWQQPFHTCSGRHHQTKNGVDFAFTIGKPSPRWHFQSPLSEAAVETSLADDSSSIGAKDEEDDDDDDDASDDRIDANNCGGDPEKLKAFNVSKNNLKSRPKD